MVAVLLVTIAVASVAVANYASALQAQGGITESAVFAEVYGYGSWMTLNGTFDTLLSVTTPNIPLSGYYHVVCDGYVSIEASAQVEIAIGVNSPTEDASTRRFYKTYGHVTLDFLLTGIHTERVYYLGPGSHTFYFLGLSSGTSRVNYHTITVTFFTHGGLTEHA